MRTTKGIGVHDQNLESHIERHMGGGCMSSFFNNLFDRSLFLAGKRLPPRLPLADFSTDLADSSSELTSVVGSPASSKEFNKCHVQRSKSELCSTPKSPLAVSTSEFKESVKSPWKFNREAPRLSLDSRAVIDAKGGLHPREIRVKTPRSGDTSDEERENQQRRSPSVIARLMGLEPAPTSSSSVSGDTPEKKVEFRRSASESRSRDGRFFDAPSFLSPVAGVKTEMSGDRKSDQLMNGKNPNYYYCSNAVNCDDPKAKNKNGIVNNQRSYMAEKKSYYNSSDFFPATECQQPVTIYGEIERRLRMRGIDEPSKDLETLKHILEALQLKGLLHSSTATTAEHNRNAVLDQRFEDSCKSPINFIPPARSSASPVNRRLFSLSGEPAVSPKREKLTRSNVRPSSGHAENNRSSNPTVRRKGGPLSLETTTVRRSHSPALSPKKNRRSSDHNHETVNRSPRSRRSTAEIFQDEKILSSVSGPNSEDNEASTISESSYSASSHTDNERCKVEEYRDGRSLLERCDKLLHSIEEMNLNADSVELQKPSPVSVLDSSFYKDDESSPSPVKKSTINFKDSALLMELEDEQWTPPSLNQLLPKHPHLHLHLDHHLALDSSDGSDFIYVSEVLRASIYLPDETDLFLLLEKQNSITNNNSKASVLQRKLIFDTITEILGCSRKLPPWKAVSSQNRPTMGQIWAELVKIQERGPSDDLLEVIRGVLKNDLARDSINGWGDYYVEMSEAVLDIERLIFKDLMDETIRDLPGKNVGGQAPRRKLVF